MAKGASTTPSLLLSLGLLDSTMLIVPELVNEPVRPPEIRTPMALFTSVNLIVPSFVTLLLLSSVTAGEVGEVSVIEPPEAMSISSAAPLLAVEVAMGVVRPLEMVVVANAVPALAMNHKGARAAAAVSVLRMKVRFADGSRGYLGRPANPGSTALSKVRSRVVSNLLDDHVNISVAFYHVDLSKAYGAFRRRNGMR